MIGVEGDSRVFFCADFHLQGGAPPQSLIKLRRETRQGDLVFILGDLFEVWFENAWNCIEGYDEILTFFRDWVSSGTRLHLVQGNRDFLAERIFSESSGVVVHRNPVVILGTGCRILACHGDELLLTDRDYLRYKAMIRSSLMRGLIRLLPISLLNRAAQKMRQKSREKVAALMQYEFHPDSSGLRRVILGYDINEIICGHLHKEMSVEQDVEGRRVSLQVMNQSTKDQLNGRILEVDASASRLLKL